jgi:hypothetical protein
MKFIYLFSLLFIVCAFTSALQNIFPCKSLFCFDNEDKHLTKADRLVGQILSQTAKSVDKKYKISACGTGISMPGGIVKEMGLAFDADQKFSKDQLRILLLQISEELLQNINSNVEIQPFLVKKPFTIENVEIIIYNKDNGRFIYDPEIAVAAIDSGQVVYHTNDPENKFDYKNSYDESYQEALEIVQKGELEKK